MHTHDSPNGRAEGHDRPLRIVLSLTVGYLAVEVAGAVFTNSLALLADAGHLLTDVGGLLLALAAMRFASRPATPERTYGYYRLEILAALANAIVLIGISVFVLYEAVERFRSPKAISGAPMFAIASIGLVVNLIGAKLLHSGAKGSLNLKGAYFEVLSDALASVGVILAAVVIWTTGWMYADAIVSAGIGLFILPRSWALVQEAVGVLLEGTPSDVNLPALRETIQSVAGVEGVHDLHVWSLTSGVNAMSAHVVLSRPDGFESARRAVVEAVRRGHAVHHITVQVECESCGDADVHG